MPPVSATTDRCGERALHKPALLAQTANFANRTLPPPSAGIPNGFDECTDGKGLGSGARVSFAKPTKDGRDNPRLLAGDGGDAQLRRPQEAPARGRLRPLSGQCRAPKDFLLPHLCSPSAGSGLRAAGRGTGPGRWGALQLITLMRLREGPEFAERQRRDFVLLDALHSLDNEFLQKNFFLQRSVCPQSARKGSWR